MVNSYDHDLMWKQSKSNHSNQLLQDHYRKIFLDLPIDRIHDCSCGSGNLTFPFIYLGYSISGSDLNEHMIRLAKDRAKEEKLSIDFTVSDFLDIDKLLKEKIDCLISTGNSIPHVTNKSVERLFEKAKRVVKTQGYLYFDIRNWDKIVSEKQRFFVYNMRILENRYNHLMQVWDYNTDGSITFNLLFHDFDKEGNIIEKTYQYVPPYYPLLYNGIEKYLGKAGFRILRRYNHNPYGNLGTEETRKIEIIKTKEEFMEVDWYSVLAQKTD